MNDDMSFESNMLIHQELEAEERVVCHRVPQLGEQLKIILIAIIVAPTFLMLAIIILDTFAYLTNLPNNRILLDIIEAIFG